MFISHTYRLIYFEVPRTGSNSITRVLTALDPESPTVVEREQHGGGAGYHHLSEELLAEPDYRLIATHRNPFDRLWSFWKHRKQNGNPEAFRSLSWTDYLTWVCNKYSGVQVAGALPDVPITEMLDIERVDIWLDFHRLDESWKQACEALDIPFMPLHVLNASPDHGPMQLAYNARSSAIVAERFALDFATFGYSTNSWQQGESVAATEK